MTVLAIDPGTNQSAYVQWRADDSKLLLRAILPNEQLLELLAGNEAITIKADVIAIEMIASYGMAVGKEVFETCVWIGRFYERCNPQPRLVYRRDVKMHHCQSPRAKDSNIWQALTDKYGKPGTKREPGLMYGLRSHARAAFALATFISETQTK